MSTNISHSGGNTIFGPGFLGTYLLSNDEFFSLPSPPSCLPSLLPYPLPIPSPSFPPLPLQLIRYSRGCSFWNVFGCYKTSVMWGNFNSISCRLPISQRLFSLILLLDSPRLSSTLLDSHRLSSVLLGSPRFSSVLLGSPRFSSTLLDSPLPTPSSLILCPFPLVFSFVWIRREETCRLT